jgi:hypothetical protein
MEAFTEKSFPRYLLIVFALAGDSTITRFLATSLLSPAVLSVLVKKMTPVSMVPDEEGPRQAADLVAKLQLTQTGQQVWRFKPAPGPEVFQADGGIRAEGGKQRILNGLDGLVRQLQAHLGGHVAGVPDEGGPVAEELVGTFAGRL